jgi:hypothetical protein
MEVRSGNVSVQPKWNLLLLQKIWIRTNKKQVRKHWYGDGSEVYVEVRSKIRIFSRPIRICPGKLHGTIMRAPSTRLTPERTARTPCQNCSSSRTPYLFSRHAGSRAYSYSSPFKPYSWSWESREVEDGSWSTNPFGRGSHRSQLPTTMPSVVLEKLTRDRFVIVRTQSSGTLGSTHIFWHCYWTTVFNLTSKQATLPFQVNLIGRKRWISLFSAVSEADLEVRRTKDTINIYMGQ